MQCLVNCPFYITDTHRPVTIKCEGISYSNSLTLTFKFKDEKISYMEKFCNSGYKNCCLYKLINDKYKQ